MPQPRLDPAGFYELDLAHGTVQTRHGDRVVVLTDTVLGRLVSSATDFASVRAVGEAVGAEAARHLQDVGAASPEVVLGEAATALGVFGWGKLGLERWGDALVATLTAPPADMSAGATCAFLGGFFSKLGAKPVACVDAGSGRFLLVDPSIEQTVAKWASSGADLPALVSKLGGGS